jgi:hypothetical protein
MSAPNTNPLSFNAWIQQVAAMAVVTASEVSGVWQFVDAPLQTIVPMILNYSEGRIQRDLDLLAGQTSNVYTLTASNPIFPLPIDDFFTVETLELLQMNGSQVVNSSTLLPVSKELIQNCYSGLANAGTPQFYAMYGSNFGDGADTVNNILLGPTPNFAYSIRVTGLIKIPSLFQYASAGVADTKFTYISSYYSDMLLMASMIYISAFQRNFGVASDDPAMGMTYEKQYQALRLGAINDENARNLENSAWTGYTTPTAATPTRGS